MLGARPDRHARDRGADEEIKEQVHDRDRHPQHAAGGTASATAPRSSPPRSTRAATGAPVDWWSTTHQTIFSNPTRRATRGLRHGAVRLMRRPVGPSFHSELDELRNEIATMARRSPKLIPRATDDPARAGPRRRRVHDPRRRRHRRRALELEERAIGCSRCSRRWPATSASIVAALQDHRRGRALGRPCCQHLQGGAPHLRPRARSAACAGSSRRWAIRRSQLLQGGDRGVPRRRRRAGRRHRRHGRRTSTTCSVSSSRRSSRATPPSTIDLQVAVQLAVVARFYERIGDHAVNIGERVALHRHRVGCPSTRARTRYAATPGGERPNDLDIAGRTSATGRRRVLDVLVGVAVRSWPRGRLALGRPTPSTTPASAYRGDAGRPDDRRSRSARSGARSSVGRRRSSLGGS